MKKVQKRKKLTTPKAKLFEKKRKTILIISVLVLIAAIYYFSPLIIQPIIDKNYYSQNPHAYAVKQAVEEKYHWGNAFIGENTHYSTFNGKTTKKTTFFIKYKAPKGLTTNEMQDMAKIACSTLHTHKKSYDRVQITTSKNYFSIVPGTFYLRAPCKDWETKNFSNIELF